MTDDFDADVVVIGAGFAGLGAARALHRAGKTVVVVEATGVVGGRARRARLEEYRRRKEVLEATRAKLSTKKGGSKV